MSDENEVLSMGGVIKEEWWVSNGVLFIYFVAKTCFVLVKGVFW